jgi:glutamate racemase
VVERFGADVELFQHTCPGLVQQIEKGELDSSATRSILEDALLPMLQKNIDTIVLGCTHYPFVIPLIQSIVGENVRVIDPAPAVSRQAGRLLEIDSLRNDSTSKGEVQIYTSGDEAIVLSLLPILLGEEAKVRPVYWVNETDIALS